MKRHGLPPASRTSPRWSSNEETGPDTLWGTHVLRRNLLGAATSVLAAPMLNLGRCRLYAGTAGEFSVHAVDIVRSSLVIDMMGLLTVDWDLLNRWHTDPSSFRIADFEALRTSGVTVFHPAVDLNCTDIVEQTKIWLQGWNRLVDGWPSVSTRGER